MFTSAVVLSFLAAASKVLAAPTPTDTEVLQFALSLEHLENAFYTEGLAKFSAQDFEKAGMPTWVRGRFEQIAGHEATHVAVLTGILGDQAVKPCEYDFGSAYKDPFAFASINGIRDRRRLRLPRRGAVFDKDYLTAAASILAVESRQASWVTSSVMHLQPWNGPFDTPLTTSGAYSLAAPFIKGCPSSNAALPVKSFPMLTISNTHPSYGERITVDYPGRGDGENYVAWLDGLQVVFSDIGADGQTKVPSDLLGTVYAAVVSSEDVPRDDNMLSGFAIVQFPFGSDDKKHA